MRVCFAYAGAEGSAHDATVLQLSSLLHQLPEHYYVLVDAGYGLSEQALTPFRRVRYHLKEWAKMMLAGPVTQKNYSTYDMLRLATGLNELLEF
ncbi:polyprotein [Phytophthora megakarya]|uniref:Polyprotein n=1 Tax=Phytophthora megakarya TaxID=4795 RepID=A0A225V9I1_9STRA|nr:polyprotein [Phytophthora megakarya]